MTYLTRQQSPAIATDHVRDLVSDDYWLRHCHGFRVDIPRGRLGIVEDVLYGAEHDRSSALAVRGGFFGRRLELVSVEDVDTVDPRHKRIVLVPSAGDRF